MQEFINYCYERAKTILTENKDKLELIAQTLLEVETLDEKQIKSLFEEGVYLEPEVAARDEDDMKVNINAQDKNAPDTYEKAKEKSALKYDEKSKQSE